MRIFHIVDRSVWARAEETGEYVPAAFDADGFVHFSFAGQVAKTANALYRDEPDLIVVEVESEGVPARFVVEDSYGSGEEFPHIYGAVPTSALVAKHELVRDMNGDWNFAVH